MSLPPVPDLDGERWEEMLTHAVTSPAWEADEAIVPAHHLPPDPDPSPDTDPDLGDELADDETDDADLSPQGLLADAIEDPFDAELEPDLGGPDWQGDSQHDGHHGNDTPFG